MEKKTMGSFIAALRKANGMTQQDLADKLNVSNKAVSRWENDEAAPDITLIPAIAEIFGVSCDELLKGERIIREDGQEKSEPKADKQLKAIINKSLSKFKTMIWISLALTVTGLILMFVLRVILYNYIGDSSAAAVGAGVNILFDIAAFVLTLIAVNDLRALKDENDLFENADPALISKFNKTLGNLSFAAFVTIFAALSSSLLLITYTANLYFRGVYINRLWSFTLLAEITALIVLYLKDLYTVRITGAGKESRKISRSLIIMNIIQLVTVAAAGVLYIIGLESSFVPFPIFLISMSADLICFIIFMEISKNERKELIIPGIRNIILSLALTPLVNCTYVVYTKPFYGLELYQKEYAFFPEYVVLSLMLITAIFVISRIAELIIKKKKSIRKS